MTAGVGDEQALLTALRAGDEAAFVRLVCSLSGGLLRMAAQHGLSPAAAEDVVQETWIVVVTRLDQFEGRSSLKSWIYSILINLARRAGKRERRVLPFSAAWRDLRQPAVDEDRFCPPHSTVGPAGSWSSAVRRWDLEPAAQLESAEVRGVIDAAIARLPQRQREVIVSRDVLGLTADEVCGALGLSQGNQRVLLHRARSRVRQSLESYFVQSGSEGVR